MKVVQYPPCVKIHVSKIDKYFCYGNFSVIVGETEED